MKWFKHMSQAHTDDKLVRLRAEYGMWGIGVYWTIVEMVAEQMKPNDPTPKAVFTVRELCSYFVVRRQKLSSYLLATRQLRLIYAVTNDNIVTIEIPKLLEIKDNYTKDLEVSTKQEVEVDKEVEVKVDTDKNIRASERKDEKRKASERFATLWPDYPRREGKKAAERHFVASVKTDEDWADIQRALKNYKAHLRANKTEPRFIKQGSTWFNNWEDWKGEVQSPVSKKAEKIADAYECRDCGKIHVVGSPEEKACVDAVFKSQGKPISAVKSLVASMNARPVVEKQDFTCKACGKEHSPKFICQKEV